MKNKGINVVNDGPHKNTSPFVCWGVGLVCSYIKGADGAEAGGTRPPKSPVCMPVCKCVCECML